MVMRIALLGLVLSMIVSGCASLSKEECARANWDAIGYGDGSHGKSASRFNAHQKACAEHGFDADFAVYKQGHQRGLNEVFCKPRNGYQLGMRGASYNNVCPAHLEREFLPAYHHGLDTNRAQRTYNNLNQQVSNIKTKLATVDDRITKLRQEIKEDDLEAHLNSVQDFRNKRGDAAALYDRIRRTRHNAKKTNRLKGHLRSELTAQIQCYERCVAYLLKKSDLVGSERQAIRRIVHLSVDTGHLESKINWVNSNPGSIRARKQETASLKRKLNGLLSEINRLKKTVYRRPSDAQFRKHLEHSFEQAAYAGKLQNHQETLGFLYDRYTLNLLVDMHFDAEMENLNQRIEFARHYAPSKEQQAYRQRRRRELRDSQRKRDDYHRRLAGLEQQIGQMQRKIEELTAASRY